MNAFTHSWKSILIGPSYFRRKFNFHFCALWVFSQVSNFSFHFYINSCVCFKKNSIQKQKTVLKIFECSFWTPIIIIYIFWWRNEHNHWKENLLKCIWTYFEIASYYCSSIAKPQKCSKTESLRPSKISIPHNVTQLSLEAAIEWMTNHSGNCHCTHGKCLSLAPWLRSGRHWDHCVLHYKFNF